MLELKVLIFELFAINRLSTCAITSSEVTALAHERFYDSVKGGAFEV